MISGTAPQTAALALSKLAAAHAQAAAASITALQRLNANFRDLKLAERRELVRAGKLPSSSALPFVVALDADHIFAEDYASLDIVGSASWALRDTVTGAYEPWFDADGNAFLSFADATCATMFATALEGGQ